MKYITHFIATHLIHYYVNIKIYCPSNRIHLGNSTECQSRHYEIRTDDNNYTIIIRQTATLRVRAKLSARGRCLRQCPRASDGGSKDSCQWADR